MPVIVYDLHYYQHDIEICHDVYGEIIFEIRSGGKDKHDKEMCGQTSRHEKGIPPPSDQGVQTEQGYDNYRNE